MTAPQPTPPHWQVLLVLQEGVLSRRQALASGMSAHAWAWKHTSERWSSLLPGVSMSHRGTPTDQQIGWAAVLHCGEGSAITGDFALLLQGWRVRQRPTSLHVAVPQGRVVRQGCGVRTEPLIPVVPHQVKGLATMRHPARLPPVVRVESAVLHAAAQAPSDRAAEWRVAAVVQQRMTTPARIRDAVAPMTRLRRRAVVRTVLDDVEQGAHAQSELDFLRLLRRHGLPLPDRLQRLVRADGKRYLDAWWERQRLAVEVDGAHHVEVGTWEADTLRANAVLVAERHDRVLLLRFTTGNLRHDGDKVAAQLRILLVG